MEDFLLGEEDIIQRVDEYTLYCHYLGFDPDPYTKYTSPIREKDEHPSFGVFHAKRMRDREFAWKDQATGECGDIFTLVKLIYGYPSKFQAVARIASDFGLGPRIADDPRIVRKVLVPKEPTTIRTVPRRMEAYDLRWWQKFNIDRVLLDMYKVRPISCYWTYPSQKIPRFPDKGLGYDYRINARHQLYFPLAAKDFKFRNDLQPELDLLGFSQLTYATDTLIITKSYKDIMCLRSFGYDSVSAQGEHSVVTEPQRAYLESRYTRIFTLFDNDGKHAGDKYPYPLRQVPVESGEKDPTDFCKRYGPQATAELLTQLIA